MRDLSTLVWRKSTRSSSNSACVEVAVWRKSTRSSSNSQCVEVATNLRDAQDAIYVRDSKNPNGAVLTFTPHEWEAFVGGVRDGDFDLA